MVWGRAQRDPERQKAAVIGHGARIISDICTFAFLRCSFLFLTCDNKIFPTKKLKGKYSELFKDLKEAENYFMEVEYGSDPTNEKTD